MVLTEAMAAGAAALLRVLQRRGDAPEAVGAEEHELAMDTGHGDPITASQGRARPV